MYASVSAAPPVAASWASEQAATDAAASPQLPASPGSLDQAGMAQSAGMSGLSLQLPAAVPDLPHELVLAAVVGLADTKVAAVAAVD